MEEIVQIHVKLHHSKNGKPIGGSPYMVRFYDKDPLKDDFLGASEPDDKGHAIVSVTRSDYISSDSPTEKYPDIYFVLLKNGEEIFRSPVCKNLHLKEAGDFAVSGGIHCDLGTYQI